MTTCRITISVVFMIILSGLVGCNASPQSDGSSLAVEEHVLLSQPQNDPFAFTPQDGTQEEVLQKHAAERSAVLQIETSYCDGNMCFSGILDGNELTATQVFTDNYNDSYVAVTRDGTEIYRIATGPASPITTLRNLWIYGSQWALETVLINPEGDDAVTPYAVGQITIDGVLANEEKSYQEAFGFQIINSEPFFFFKKDGIIGYSYAGQETMTMYEEIPHYACCSESVLNPIAAQDMVAFFARSGETWYYVEIGAFDN